MSPQEELSERAGLIADASTMLATMAEWEAEDVLRGVATDD